MKERILKLCKRLNKFSLDEIETISEIDSEELKPIIDGLIHEERLTYCDGTYYYNKRVCKKQQTGSVIYSEKAMKHLKEIGIVVYLNVSYEEIANRLGNVKERGVVLKDGMTLRDLYDERVPLYEKYADITVNEDGMSAGQIVDYLRKNDFGYKME